MSIRTSKKINVYAHVFRGVDAKDYKKRFESGLEPDESPYGFHKAREFGMNIRTSSDAPFPLITRRIDRITGLDFSHALTNSKNVRAANVIWAMTEREAFAVALLFALRIVRARPIISNAVWLLDHWGKLPRSKRVIYRLLSRYISAMTVHSQKCLEPARLLFPNIDVEMMYFGVNTGVFEITPPKSIIHSPIRIMAAGNDATRDWDTLLAAFGNDDRFHLTIFCPWLSQDRASAFSNVVVPQKWSMAICKAAYRDADIIAVPMVVNLFSGITVALEAAALGKPILSTRTGGVPSYFTEDEAIYCVAGDPDGMRDAVLRQEATDLQKIAARAQARFIQEDYSTRAVMGRYAKITEKVMESCQRLGGSLLS
jgi:glycosyltransferase involved in cell wall biosynthesis